MRFRLQPPPTTSPSSPTYEERKVKGQCCRSGCDNECQDDHQLCPACAEDHRRANNRYDHFRRKQLALPFIQYVDAANDES